jgi:glyoxalase family protein
MVGALTAQGLHPTEQINRCCFRSAYFRARRAACCSRSRPTILADDSGFTVDEPKETPGDAIKLPPWCESRRAEIVAALPPLR